MDRLTAVEVRSVELSEQADALAGNLADVRDRVRYLEADTVEPEAVRPLKRLRRKTKVHG